MFERKKQTLLLEIEEAKKKAKAKAKVKAVTSSYDRYEMSRRDVIDSVSRKTEQYIKSLDKKDEKADEYIKLAEYYLSVCKQEFSKAHYYKAICSDNTAIDKAYMNYIKQDLFYAANLLAGQNFFFIKNERRNSIEYFRSFLSRNFLAKTSARYDVFFAIAPLSEFKELFGSEFGKLPDCFSEKEIDYPFLLYLAADLIVVKCGCEDVEKVKALCEEALAHPNCTELLRFRLYYVLARCYQRGNDHSSAAIAARFAIDIAVYQLKKLYFSTKEYFLCDLPLVPIFDRGLIAEVTKMRQIKSFLVELYDFCDELSIQVVKEIEPGICMQFYKKGCVDEESLLQKEDMLSFFLSLSYPDFTLEDLNGYYSLITKWFHVNSVTDIQEPGAEKVAKLFLDKINLQDIGFLWLRLLDVSADKCLSLIEEKALKITPQDRKLGEKLIAARDIVKNEITIFQDLRARKAEMDREDRAERLEFLFTSLNLTKEERVRGEAGSERGDVVTVKTGDSEVKAFRFSLP